MHHGNGHGNDTITYWHDNFILSDCCEFDYTCNFKNVKKSSVGSLMQDKIKVEEKILNIILRIIDKIFFYFSLLSLYIKCLAGNIVYIW